MAETKKETIEEFWLFHDFQESEMAELRKFIDPDLDFKSLQGFDDLLDRLNNLVGKRV